MASAQTIELVDGVDEAEEVARLAVRGMQLSIEHTVILDDLFFEVAPRRNLRSSRAEWLR